MFVRDLALRMRARRVGAIASPPGQWTLTRLGTTRIWRGYGTEIRIEPQGFGQPWTVTSPDHDEPLYEGTHPFRFATDYCRRVMDRATAGRPTAATAGRAD